MLTAAVPEIVAQAVLTRRGSSRRENRRGGNHRDVHRRNELYATCRPLEGISDLVAPEDDEGQYLEYASR
jgi:hypothetical protein